MSNVYAGDFEDLRALQVEADRIHNELIAKGKSSGDSGDSSAWVSARESGYVNCLLTVLAEGTKDSVSVSQVGPLPSLKELAAGNADLERWVSSLEFPYNELSSEKVVDILAGSFESQTGNRGRLKTILVRSDGSPLAVIFYAEVVSNSLKISVIRGK